jgi:hypothetical protein
MRRGFLYLVAVMDWPKVLSWRLFTIWTPSLHLGAGGGPGTHEPPEIFNTD